LNACRTHLTPGRVRGLVSFLVWGALGGAVSACETAAVYGWAGPLASRWQEFQPSGKSLLREQGTLWQRGVGWRGNCDEWHVQLELAQSSGQRDYQGQSNRGVAVQTISRLSGRSVDAQLWRAVDEDWSLGGRWHWRQTHRDLVSVGDVLGYEEVHVQPGWAVGVQHVWRSAAGGAWQGRFWQGQGHNGRVKVALPAMDPAVLPLGSSRWWGAQVQWSACPPKAQATGWACDVSLDYMSERMARGAEVPIYSQGLLKLGAHQPATRQQSLLLRVAAEYRFD